jgi:energy-coupling factor transporter ATP-binding protein EcfA2
MFNLNKIGREICQIENGKCAGKVVYYSDKSSGDDTHGLFKEFSHLELNGDSKFAPYPDKTKERNVITCFGPSGSGKSFYVKLFLRAYKKEYPSNEIYMFSKLKDDKSLDDIAGIKRVKIDDDLLHDPLETDDFKDSCVIMDDTDALLNKHHKRAVDDLKNSVLETGRHTNSTLLITSHLACKGLETRTVLNESHQITIYLSSGSSYDYLLTNYLGFSRKQIALLKTFAENSRWVTIVRGFPQIIFTEKAIMLLKDLN